MDGLKGGTSLSGTTGNISKAAQHQNFNTYRRPFPKFPLSYTGPFWDLPLRFLLFLLQGASLYRFFVQISLV